jgi:tetratricopeptide (TPR) repeat protein
METVDIFKNAHYGRGMRLYDSGLFTEAIAEFEQVIQSAPEERTPERRLASFFMGEAYITLGLTHLRMNMYRRAEEELKFALVLHPEYADLRFHLAVVYYKLNQYDDAEEQLRKALATNPKYARAMMYLGLTLLRKGEEVGLAEIANSMSVESAYDRGIYEQALSLYRAGEIRSSMGLLEELADTDVDKVKSLLEDGLQLLQDRKYSQAFVIFEQAVSSCPDYPDLRHYLGQCYMNLGMTKQAIEQLRKAVEINPRYTAARLNLAAAYEKAGRTDHAIMELKNVLKIDPMNPAAEKGLKSLNRKTS